MALDRSQAPTLAAPAANALLLPFLALIAGAVAMGISPVFVRLADVGPFSSAFWRVALALPVLWVWMRWDTGLPAGIPRSASLGRSAVLIGLSGFLFAGDLFFWHLAIMETTVANATFFATMAPLVTVTVAALLLGELLARSTLAGLVLCLLGAGLILGSSLRLDPARLAGDGFGIITAVFFGLYMISVKMARRYLPTSALMFWSTLVTALILFIVALSAEPRLLPGSFIGLVMLLALAIVSHTGGQGLLAFALGHLPATFSSLVVFLEAVAAAIFGLMILGEQVGALQIIGGVAILCGIFVARPRAADTSTSGGGRL